MITDFTEKISVVDAKQERHVITLVESKFSLFNMFHKFLELITPQEQISVQLAEQIANIGLGIYNNIQRWWNGEISGEQCIKNLLDLLPRAAGVAGGYFGAVIGGAIGGPVGAGIGAPVGALISYTGMKYLANWIKQKMFGIPKEDALENSYQHLGVKKSASNADINRAFRKLALKKHPDRGGSQEDFLILQFHMVIIKQAREDCFLFRYFGFNFC
ncbi:Hypothetical predicted protein [Paramuricea clavata]|nr:Hypothetical predicted protein [Paramuricea clavata]